jgi:ABC-type Fe3+/spermidine/putrescine transport system ATPase subunit
MYPVQEKIMEPRFNIRVADMANPDNNFQDPNQQWIGDFIDTDSNHFDKNMDAYMQQRQGLGDQIQRYVDESHMHAQDANPAQDRALMVQEPEVAGTGDLQLAPVKASKLASQANGFRNDQARVDFTLGIVAKAANGTLVNARVVAETPATKIAGTVLAVGDAEFAVLWDDKTASVERKADYELVFSN